MNINQIGIILNFLAGFLITPELLGVKRLKKIEKYFESKLEAIKFLFNRTLESISEYSLLFRVNTRLYFFILVLIAEIIMIIFFFELIKSAWSGKLGTDSDFSSDFITFYLEFSQKTPNLVLNLIFIILLFVFLVISFYSKPISSNNENIFVVLTKHFVFTIIIFVLFLFSPILLILISILYGILNFIVHSIKLLEQQENFRTIVVSTGIVLYILGNVLQFLATFVEI